MSFNAETSKFGKWVGRRNSRRNRYEWHQSDLAMFGAGSAQAGGRRQNTSSGTAEFLWAARYMLG
jgi:hypothetical protein